MEEGGGGELGDDLRLAEKLAREPDSEAQERWENLGGDQLLGEISEYRRALRAVGAQVETLKAAASEETTTRDEASPPDDGLQIFEIPVEDVDPIEWQVPPHCVPIHADVTSYDWEPLCASTQFDVIMMDPPWLLATANPTRGVSLGYGQLTAKDIQNLPITRLQTDGLLLIWVINSSYGFAMDLFKRWGYSLVDELVWVKQTVNRRLAKSHGFYLQHAKEVRCPCL